MTPRKPALHDREIALAKRIRELRKERGLSQRALAEEVGVTEAAVQSWERMRSRVASIRLRPLARALSVDLHDLLGDSMPEEDTLEDRVGRLEGPVAAMEHQLGTIEAKLDRIVDVLDLDGDPAQIKTLVQAVRDLAARTAPESQSSPGRSSRSRRGR